MNTAKLKFYWIITVIVIKCGRIKILWGGGSTGEILPGGGHEQIFGWWGGGTPPILSTGENLDSIAQK